MAESHYPPFFVAYTVLKSIPLTTFELCLDRTNWKAFGFEANFLVLAIRYKNTAIPVLVVPVTNKDGKTHRGNSNTATRKCLLKQFITYFGAERIQCLVADREFIGADWFKYLEEIPFCIRIRQDSIIQLRDGKWLSAWELIGDKTDYFGEIYLDGLWLNIGAKWIVKEGKEETLIVVSNRFCGRKLLEIYRKRWSIEVCFQGMKSRGFNIEMSKLSDIDRLCKLFMLVSLAYLACLSIGLHDQKFRKNNPKKGKKYKANSYARRGTDLIRRAFMGYTQAINDVKQWICSFLNYFSFT